MKIFDRLFRKKKQPDLRKAVGEYIARQLGEQYVEEALQDYDTLASGGVIGDLNVTIAFLNMVENVKKELEEGKSSGR